MTVNVMYDRVLVRRIEPEKITPSGLILTTKSSSVIEHVIVVQIGTGKGISTVDVVVGNVVVFLSGSGTTVVLNEEKLILLNENELLAVQQD